MNVVDCKIIELPKIVDPRGNLSIIEQIVKSYQDEYKQLEQN